MDQGSQGRLAAFPFAGSKFFGQTLDPLLENKDKVLPTNKKEPYRDHLPFFRGHSLAFVIKKRRSQAQVESGKIFPQGMHSQGRRIRGLQHVFFQAERFLTYLTSGHRLHWGRWGASGVCGPAEECSLLA